MPHMTSVETRTWRSSRAKRKSFLPNGSPLIHESPRRPPSLIHSKPASLENIVHKSVDRLFQARKVVNQIQDFQKAEQEGGILPVFDNGEEEKARRKEESDERKRKRKNEREEAIKRRRAGGEVGETEAILTLKKASAAMLAHAGFEGALGAFWVREDRLIG